MTLRKRCWKWRNLAPVWGFFMNLNLAFEIGAILNGDSLRGNIAYGEG